jgi:predicted nucleic acid-binding Zn ribbon protein
MPVYIYEHPTTRRVVEIVQKMNDVHEYVENGIRFRRVFVNPQAAIDTKVDPFSKADFMRRTNKRMTYGEMMDEAADLSDKRAKKLGKDPIKEKVIADYERRTKKPHPSRKKGKQRFENKHFILET